MKSVKKILFTFFVSAFSLLLISNSVSSQQTAGELFEKALYMEEAKGDLQKAIDLYQKILKQFPENREVAAKAQLHIGLCFEKLGLKEAKKAFQKVVDNYPEQAEAVKVAKEKLSVLLRAQGFTEKRDKDFRIQRVWTGRDIPFLRGGPFPGTPSPDGRYLSFVDVKNGDLAVLELATKKKRLLTDKASLLASEAFMPVWSPDSKLLAYAWFTIKDTKNFLDPDVSGDLRLIGLDGSKPRVFYRNEEFLGVLPFDWSADGKHILVGMLREDMTGQVALLTVADGSERVIKTFDKTLRTIPRKVLFSPDGRYIVYDLPPKEKTEKHDIFLFSTDGSREIALIEHPADDFVLGWSPDGKRLVFASNRTGTIDVWAIQVTAGRPLGNPELIRKNIGEMKPLGLTRKGSFYYGVQTSMVDVYVAKLDIEKGELLTSPEKAVQRFVGSNGCPEWSPDGKYLAYKSWRRPDREFGLGSRGLHIRSIESGKELEFIPELKAYYEIRWSPDSRSILTVGLDKEDCRQIYRIDAQTGDMESIVQVDPGEFAQWATWSPDGKKIFYTSYTRSRRRCPILMYNLVAKQKKEIYHKPISSPDKLALSPDGRFLAFVTFYSKDLSRILNIMPASGGESRELLRTERGEQIETVAWTPDSRWLLFARRKSNEQKCNLWRISVEEGRPQKLGLAMDQLRYLSIHPDGQRVAFHSIQKSNEIWVMENFLPEGKGN